MYSLAVAAALLLPAQTRVLVPETQVTAKTVYEEQEIVVKQLVPKTILEEKTVYVPYRLVPEASLAPSSSWFGRGKSKVKIKTKSGWGFR